MAALTDPLRINGCEIRNRLYRAPVLEGAGSGPDAPRIYREAFETNARASVGLIIQGNSCITEEGRSAQGMTLVNTRERMLALAEVTEAVHRHGGRIFLQIGHAGIYSIEAWHATYARERTGPVLAVSKPPIHVRAATRGVPLEILSTERVYEIAKLFGRCAAWAREAGYDGIQLPSSNAKAIKERFDEALDRSRLKWAVLRWGYRRAAKQYPFEPVWNRPYFTAAKRAVGIPVFAVGGIRTLAECEGILERGEADMVGMGRP